MKYIGDYSFKQIEEFFNGDFSVKEKLDGSYLIAGKDSNGNFYTQRKGNKVYYHVDDWDDLAWTNAFKSSHLIMEQWFEELENSLKYKLSNFSVELEILNGKLPNTIPYDVINKMSIKGILGTDVSFPLLKAAPQTRIIAKNPDDILLIIYSMSSNDFLIKKAINMMSLSFMFSSFYIYSDDGIKLEKKRITANGFVFQQSFINRRHSILESFNAFKGYHAFVIDGKFYKVSVDKLWDLNLSSKPEFIDTEFWRTDKIRIKERLKHIRDEVKTKLQNMLFSDTNFNIGTKISIMSNVEGFVFANDNIKFKIIWPEFQKYNRLTHIVRYWLQDGRRPSRPCFLTRTKNWDKQKKLERLDVLLSRYKKHKTDLCIEHDPAFNYGTLTQLDERTLVLFAEIRRDIINGRYCV